MATKAEKAKAAAAKAKAAAAKAKAKAVAAKAASVAATAEAEAEVAEAEAEAATAEAAAETAVAEEAAVVAAPRAKAPHESQLDRYMGEGAVKGATKKISTSVMNQLRFNMNAIQPLGQIIGRYKLHRGSVMDDFTISVIE